MTDSAGESATVYTDQNNAYQKIPHHHETIKHSVGEYVREQVHTNGIESLWALLKRGYHGTYHHMSKKHLNRYVQEFAGRFNDRPKDTSLQLALMADGMEDKRLKYSDLIA